MLNDMKSVKMLGLGDKLYACVSTLRQVELQVSQKFRVLLIWQVVLCMFFQITPEGERPTLMLTQQTCP